MNGCFSFSSWLMDFQIKNTEPGHSLTDRHRNTKSIDRIGNDDVCKDFLINILYISAIIIQQRFSRKDLLACTCDNVISKKLRASLGLLSLVIISKVYLKVSTIPFLTKA